jgi:hypothetical protein
MLRTCMLLLMAPAAMLRPVSATSLSVSEDKIELHARSGSSEVSLLVQNDTGSPLAATVDLVVVDTEGRARSRSRSEETLAPGSQRLNLDLIPALDLLPASEQQNLFLYRLRYRLTTKDRMSTVQGVVALSVITPDLFELRLFNPRSARAGARMRAVVLAQHPVSRQGVAGVGVTARLRRDAGVVDPIRTPQPTDMHGLTFVEFDLPRVSRDEEVGLDVEGHCGIARVRVESEFLLNAFGRLTVSTDRPLYQPGHTVHARLLALDAGRPVANAKGKLEVLDEEYEKTYSVAFTTSRFGIASVDWRVPESARLGKYSLEARLVRGGEEEFEYGETWLRGEQSVNVSRYDRPTFVVSVRPDRGYYLPGQGAKVEVGAEYPLGKPVSSGSVSVVRGHAGHWSFAEQKWVAEEKDAIEGILDESGKFVAALDLAKDHEDIKDPFRDLDFTATVTDTTGRSEERRFLLRIAREPIQVYLIPWYSDRQASGDGTRLAFYVVTTYADGTPASCDVRILRETEDGKPQPAAGAARGIELMSVRTNEYGVAAVRSLGLALSLGDEHFPVFIFLARDSQGRTGEATGFMTEAFCILMETPRVLHAVGEPIEVAIRSNSYRGRMLVDLISGACVLQSRIVSLRDGRASLTFPYEDSFQGALQLVGLSIDDYHGCNWATRGVLFPGGSELGLRVTPDRGQYRPDDERPLDSTVQRDDDLTVQGILGAVAPDKALDERTASDRVVAAGAGFLPPVMTIEDGELVALGGITLRQLSSRPVSQTRSPALDLVAEILLVWQRVEHFLGMCVSDGTLSRAASRVYDPVLRRQLEPLRQALEKRYPERSESPKSLDEVYEALRAARVPFSEWRDPWGTPYRMTLSDWVQRMHLEVRSAGPDKRLDTRDDLFLLLLDWWYFARQGALVDRAAAEYHDRTGDVLRNEAQLKAELERLGENITAWRDRWGHGYRTSFELYDGRAFIFIYSAGPNGRFDDTSSDDIRIWDCAMDYFAKPRKEIGAVLERYASDSGCLPRDAATLASALENAGVGLDRWLDPRGLHYHPTFRRKAVLRHDAELWTYTGKPGSEKKGWSLVPISLLTHYDTITLWSGRPGKWGNVAVATYEHLATTDQEDRTPADRAQDTAPLWGAIGGRVLDCIGEAIPDVEVVAAHLVYGNRFTEHTDSQGNFVIERLRPGEYSVKCHAPGFRSLNLPKVPVQPGRVTAFNISLEPAEIVETMTVPGRPSGIPSR